MQDNVKTSSEKYEVSPLELIFDLVFAFAVSQLSSHLLDNLSWRGMVEMIVMLVAVYNVWLYASSQATFVHVGKIQTQWMMMTVMLLGLFMNASINHAFGEAAWTFITPFMLSQIGIGVFANFTATRKLFKIHFLRMLGWIFASAPFWIAGLFVDSGPRLIWWGIAAGIDIIGTWLAHPVPGCVLGFDNVEFDADHMIERCRLFLIIALGEAIFNAAAALSAVSINLMTLLAGMSSLISIVALGALYFGGSDHMVVRHAEETTNPIMAAGLAAKSEIVTVTGIILFSVGIELAISYLYAGISALGSTLLFGGPILYLISQGWYLWQITKKIPYYRIVGGMSLMVAGFILYLMNSYFSLFFVTILLASLSGVIICSVKKEN
ncbi:low temperature requirement A [Clostridium sp. DL-VIII]|uniref:low temperature requirement protein A n=1 Tax=Clostridium sp. DL-VIII TaxID=641107 RepID=UPI00023B0027|nr:low temperature requirement protein A [Clostridium sp. DL-VIII]EHI99143.1 low temperature requirement A [Clostridium sp. DL-VIII]